MKLIFDNLDKILIAAAIGQLMIALINLRLDKMLNWGPELKRLPDLLQEVFTVHKWFITITLVIFGGMVERYLGAKRYLAFYLLCGVAGAVMYLALNGLALAGQSMFGQRM